MTNALQIAAIISLLHGTSATVIGLAREAVIISSVADQEQLDESQMILLCALRRVESGPSGDEWGCFSDYPRHPAHRFRRNPERSVRLQATYAAQTIRKRYDGDIDTFCRRWCPPNWRNEARNLKWIIGKWRIDQIGEVKLETD